MFFTNTDKRPYPNPEGVAAMVLKYTLFWIPMVFIAIINGAIRDLTYKKYLGELSAHQVSTVTGIILFGIYIYALGLRWKLESARQALIVGMIWLSLTVAFEFIFFHYAIGRPWSELLGAYNILEGKVWVLVLVFIAVAPCIFYRIQAGHRK
jgi:hypothetical protein